VVACGNTVSILDAAANAATKLVRTYAPAAGDFFSAFAFRDDMFCVGNAATTEFLVFGSNNGWAAPIYSFVANKAAPHAGGNLIVAVADIEFSNPRKLEVHYFSSATNAFTAVRYEIEESDFRNPFGLVTVAAGMLLRDFREEDKTLAVDVIAPPLEVPPPGAPIRVLKSVRLLDVPRTGEMMILNIGEVPMMQEGNTIMDGVAAVYPSRIYHHRNVTRTAFDVGWVSRGLAGEPRLAVTSIRFPRRMADTGTVYFDAFSLNEERRIAAIVLQYERIGGERWRAVYVVNVDTGKQLRKKLILRYAESIYKVLKEI